MAVYVHHNQALLSSVLIVPIVTPGGLIVYYAYFEYLRSNLDCMKRLEMKAPPHCTVIHSPLTPSSHPLIPILLPPFLPPLPGGSASQMQFLARNHQAVSHKYSMHEGEAHRIVDLHS